MNFKIYILLVFCQVFYLILLLQLKFLNKYDIITKSLMNAFPISSNFIQILITQCKLDNTSFLIY